MPIKYDQAGNAWMVDANGGSPVLVRQAAPPAMTTRVAPPAYPYEGPQAATNLQRSQIEVRNAEATSAATVSKTKSEAQSAAIKAATDAINFRNQSGQVPGNANLRGEDYLKSLPAGMADMVRAMDQGRLGVPINMRNPQMMQVVAAASHYDPSFDAAKYNTRLTALRAGAAGKLGSSDNALNTAIVHAGMLWDQSGGTAGHDLGLPILNGPVSMSVNALQNWSNKGSPGLVTYNDTAGKLAGEEAMAYGMGTQGERDTLLKHFDPNMSEAAKKAAITNAMDLFASKMAANLHQYQWGNMGNQKPSLDLLDPEARATLQRIAPEVLAKHFSDQPDPMALALGVSSYKAPPSGGNGSGGPSGGAGGPPPTDPTAPATGPTRTEITRGPVEKQIAAMLAGGTPSATIKAYAAQNNFPSDKVNNVLAWRALHPTYKGGYDVSTENVIPTTAYQRAAASPLAAGIVGAGDAATMGLGDEAIGAVNTLKNGGSLGDNIASANYSKQLLESANPNASLAGNVLGGAGAMIAGGSALAPLIDRSAPRMAAWLTANPMKAAALGDTAYGAAYGAGENNDNRALGAGIGAAVAPVASLVGSGLTNAAGSVLGGIANPAVRRLSDAGIPLTAGEALGGGWKKAQDALTSVFGPGNMVARRYAEGRRALNEAAFNQAGAPIGANVNAVGQEGINALDAAKSKAYSAALDPISLNLNDPKFLDSMQGAIAAADKIPGAELPEGYGGVAIRHYIGDQAPDGTMTGAAFQRAYRGLSQTASKAAPKIEGYDIGQAIAPAQDALKTVLQEQNPGAYEAFKNANSTNRMLNILAAANKAAKNQITDGGEVLFTPAQLGTAATNNAVKYGDVISATGGNRPFNQLINDSQQVMSSKLPESGSVPRWLATSLATGGLTAPAAAAGYGANGGEGAAETGLGTLGLLALGGSKIGQQAITAALMKRTLADQIAARGLKRNPTVGGNLLASLGIPLLDSPSP